jgi:cytoskeletal protein CcmA (bactofilin family)
MLSNFKNTSPNGAPNIPTPHGSAQRGSRSASAPSVIGTDLTIIGNLVSSGQVQVEGEIQGDIHGTHLVVGEEARITGGIVSEEVVVRGTVMGSIRGRRVMLQAESKVEGDIYHQTLAIEQGAYFEGKSRRSDDPMSVQRSANGVPPPAA